MAMAGQDPPYGNSSMATIEVKVPDIGGYDDVPVIEVLVAVGDSVARDQGLVTLESDKATMEVPSPVAGVVKELKAKLGDKLAEGSVVAVLETEAADAPTPPAVPAPSPASAGEGRGGGASEATKPQAQASAPKAARSPSFCAHAGAASRATATALGRRRLKSFLRMARILARDPLIRPPVATAAL